MKSHPTIKYTVSQLNNYPTGVPAIGIVSTLFWATLTDFLHGKRYLVGYFIGVTGIVTSAMVLAASKDPTNSHSTTIVFAAYYWAGAVYACQATFFAWCNDAMRFEEPVFRGVVLAGMNLGSNAVNAWWSIIFYGASMAPWFTVSLPPSLPSFQSRMSCGQSELTFRSQRGMWAMIACSIALVIWCAALSWFHHRDSMRRNLDAVEQGSTGPDAKEEHTMSKYP
jgi:ACS family pantothenate transporter-like MFS transporter